MCPGGRRRGVAECRNERAPDSGVDVRTDRREPTRFRGGDSRSAAVCAVVRRVASGDRRDGSGVRAVARLLELADRLARESIRAPRRPVDRWARVGAREPVVRRRRHVRGTRRRAVRGGRGSRDRADGRHDRAGGHHQHGDAGPVHGDLPRRVPVRRGNRAVPRRLSRRALQPRDAVSRVRHRQRRGGPGRLVRRVRDPGIGSSGRVAWGRQRLEPRRCASSCCSSPATSASSSSA